VHNICLHYLLNYCTEEQKSRWIPGLASGELVPAIAMTEPDTGTDLQAIKTTATKNGDSYIINGSKTFITNGQTANLIIAVAKTDPTARGKGISLIVIETEKTKGVIRGRNLSKMGLKAQDTSELVFNNVCVETANLIGGVEGQGFNQLMSQLPWERLQIAMYSVGSMDAMLNETVRYTKERNVFGSPLIKLQNTRFQLAEAKTKLEVTRAFVNECVVKFINGNLDAPSASMAKWWGSQMQCEVADECLQLFGGYGYMTEYPISRMYTDARVQKIYGGTNEIQKELIARSLESQN
jgi:acyl-CoA dehydrogenase